MSPFKETSRRLNTLSLEAQKFAKLGWLMDQVCICHCQLLLFIGNISFIANSLKFFLKASLSAVVFRQQIKFFLFSVGVLSEVLSLFWFVFFK